ncbi:MAG: GDP-mannose 4,6-dehydratase [Bacteroides sp.]|nr:GDP-mannose 4,6-dehydratase [Prevotella sp.]MCM1408573.1 GDP-mannose 4,6-dehydratase [Treponema brennaborense]MCM1468938.1 GDP-mannose 4,6-dehydratase [Bacteroides sp.]
MQKYLVTGYAGFVGYHFIAYLNSIAKEIISILGLDVNIPNDFSKWDFQNLIIEHCSINLMNLDEVRSTVMNFKPTHIVHLAAFSSVGKSWQKPAEYFSNNTGIFLNLLESVKDSGLYCKILNIGSSEEYGFVKENQLPLVEDMRINPANPYAVTKMAQESIASVYSRGFGMDIVSTRSFNHIGPRQQDTFVVASFAKQVANVFLDRKKSLDLTTGNLNIIRDFLDVRDVVSAYKVLLEKGKSGEVYNICSGEGISLNAIIKELSEISGIRISTHMDINLLRPNDISKIIGCNQKLINDTGWKRVYTLHQTLADTFNYWKEYLSK